MFLFSLVYYVFYLQPVKGRVVLRASDVQLMCICYVTGVKVKSREQAQEMLLTKMLQLRLRRRRHLVKVVTKLYGRTNGDQETKRYHDSWTFLSTNSTFAPFLRQVGLLQSEMDDMGKWQKDKLEKLQA